MFIISTQGCKTKLYFCCLVNYKPYFSTARAMAIRFETHDLAIKYARHCTNYTGEEYEIEDVGA